MKGLSKRDRTLLLGLPAAMLLLVYSLFSAKPALDELKELRRQAGVLENKIPSNAERAGVRRELVKLRAEAQQLRRQNSNSETTASALVPSAEATMQADAFFEALLDRHQLILMSEALAEASDTRAFRRVVESSPGTTLWNVELAGNYQNVAGLLAAIGDTDLPLTPVAVEMDASLQTRSDLRRWNLWIYR